MAKETKPKKIVFSAEIDSQINGLALGFSFISVGLVLLFVPDYFGIKLVGQIIRWLFIIVGGLGLIIEFGKLKPLSDIKGFDDLWLGVLFLAGWTALFFLTHSWVWNILGFLLLVMGLYGTFLGVFRIIYSIRLNKKINAQPKGTIISDVLVFLTKVVSLALVVLQFIKAVKQ